MTQTIPTQTPWRLTRRLAVAAAVAALGGAAVLVLQRPVEAAANSAPPQAMPVGVAEAVEREIVPFSEFSGRLEATSGVEVRARVAGYIESVHFAPGSIVNKGDTLFVIDPKPFAAEVARAAAAVAAAEARQALAQTEFARARALLEENAISQREHEERRNALREAEAALAGARAALTAAELQLGYTRITAPIGGRVGRAEVTPGNLVAAGAASPVLTTIVALSPIYASFEADERTFAEHAGRRAGRVPVQLGLADEAGHPRSGVIESFDNRVDPRSGTVRVRALFDNKDGALTPGLYARVKLGAQAPRRAVLVSDLAIGTDQHKRYVYVVGADNKLEWREVRLGARADGLRVVEHGLQGGERVVVSGVQRVRPGMQVAPQPVPAEPAAAAAARQPEART